MFAFDIKFLLQNTRRASLTIFDGCRRAVGEEPVYKNWTLRNLIYSRFLLTRSYERQEKRDANFFVFFIYIGRVYMSKYSRGVSYGRSFVCQIAVLSDGGNYSSRLRVPWRSIPRATTTIGSVTDNERPRERESAPVCDRAIVITTV